MATFTPTTYGEKINDESGGGEKGRHSVWRLYGSPIQTSYVVIIRSGVANASPGSISPDSMTQITGNAEVTNAVTSYAAADSGSGDDGRAVFRGGATYTVTAGEETILLAAGYTMD